MPDEVWLNDERGIIEVRSHGRVSREDIAASIARIRQIQSANGVAKILVDTTQQETMPSTLGIYEIFSAFPRDLKLAILTNNGQATAGDIAFVETVGLNRGVRVRQFQDEKEALTWLQRK